MSWLGGASDRERVTPDLRRRVEAALGHALAQSRPLAGGNIADVSRVTTRDGKNFVVKYMRPRTQPTHPTAGHLPKATLRDEAFMLERLRSTGTVPVPEVLHADRDLLILDFIDTDGGTLSDSSQQSLADVVAVLHDQSWPRFGFDRPTPIGPLQRPNPWTTHWPSFLRDHRLMFLGHLAQASGRLPDGCFARLEKLCDRLDRWIPATATPSLIHGDLWIGNILFRNQRLAAVIDPACYYADAEIELAFLTLFGGVGVAFFSRYREHRAIDPLFFTERQTLYHIEPLLAHAWFSGGGYGARADAILRHHVG